MSKRIRQWNFGGDRCLLSCSRGDTPIVRTFYRGVPTAMMQLKYRIKRSAVRRVVLAVLAAFAAFMVVGRLISGVHWLTDIIGGVQQQTKQNNISDATAQSR